MKAHDWFIEHRTEFAARLLDPDDEATFEAHLPHCAECGTEVEQLAQELALLPMGVAPVTLRPGLRRRIVDHAVGDSPRGYRNWMLAAAAVACLLCGAGGWVAGQRQATGIAAIDRTRLAALEDTVSIMRGAARVMQASFMMDGQESGVVIFADSVTHRWNVVMHDLPPAPPDEQYQFWFITSDGMVRGTNVPTDPTRPAMFTTGMPSRGGKVMGAALILEPMGSPPDGPPRGKHLVHLML
jgi:anti-sigma-K factor RskA